MSANRARRNKWNRAEQQAVCSGCSDERDVERNRGTIVVVPLFRFPTSHSEACQFRLVFLPTSPAVPCSHSFPTLKNQGTARKKIAVGTVVLKPALSIVLPWTPTPPANRQRGLPA